MCLRCSAMIAEMQAAHYHVAHADDGISEKLWISFFHVFFEFNARQCDLELTIRTPVKILSGTRAGQVGTIAGDMKARDALREQGLHRAIVCMDQDEFIVCEMDNLRELSVHEQILLGMK